jgi:Fe-S-cluster-containing hydrogenase component 2
MGSKFIFLDPSKCNGCGDCETACSVKRTGLDNPSLSCIRVIQNENIREFYLPILCMQCTHPPCMEACPRDALYRDMTSNGIMIDYNRCVGCRMCYAACPFGAMGFDDLRGRAFKCDFCDGNPECVHACKTDALTFIEDVQHLKAASSAANIYNAFHGQS